VHSLRHNVERDGKGVTNDDTVTMQWFRKGAEQGHARPQYNLGVIYKSGKGVNRDMRAESSGTKPCRCVVSARRVGVTQDYTAALHWYRKAAAQGYKMAFQNWKRHHKR